MAEVGLVAIGRNEGERLRVCLESAVKQSKAVVYVDSNSSDGSVALARSLGVESVALDLSIPFSAARARNAGFERLLQCFSQLTYVQFVDGDCEVVPGWLDRARQELESRPDAAVVCGRRRERYPNATIYNRLCDVEWDTPIGEARACGGDAMMRVSAFQQVKGYNPDVIAAEDDEICVRLRCQGWKVIRIDADMTIHDAAMTSALQWWKRALRCGFAYAQGAYLHGAAPERHFLHERRRACVWGLAIPALALAAAWPTGGWSLLLGLLYPLQVIRLYRNFRRRNLPPRVTLAYAIACVLSSFPQCFGIVKFTFQRWRKAPPRIIEYK
jgi:glycosyltransferase involved in cell wall biosynthesis